MKTFYINLFASVYTALSSISDAEVVSYRDALERIQKQI